MGFAFEAPWRMAGVTEAEFSRRVSLDSEFCVLDGTTFFVRGVLEIPIPAAGESFCWGVWCSLSRASYERAVARWSEPGAEREEPAFGWLCCKIPGYAEPTLNLKTMVHPQTCDTRPLVRVEPGSHPIADEQASGITIERWHALVKAALASMPA